MIVEAGWLVFGGSWYEFNFVYDRNFSVIKRLNFKFKYKAKWNVNKEINEKFKGTGF